MSIFTMHPVVNYKTLKDAVNLQFDTYIDDICELLFDDDYINNSYKGFYFDEMEVYNGYFWENEEDIRLKNIVRAYLKDILPNYKYVLIDISK